eukprot:scaffold103006_cov30-Tisochrysis_lutea.AAC.1
MQENRPYRNIQCKPQHRGNLLRRDSRRPDVVAAWHRYGDCNSLLAGTLPAREGSPTPREHDPLWRLPMRLMDDWNASAQLRCACRDDVPPLFRGKALHG